VNESKTKSVHIRRYLGKWLGEMFEELHHPVTAFIVNVFSVEGSACGVGFCDGDSLEVVVAVGERFKRHAGYLESP
jgi:hypothetical protein